MKQKELLTKLNNILKLTPQERESLRSSIEKQMIDMYAPRKASWYTMINISQTIITSLVIALISGVTLTTAADQSLPGDKLYPVKIYFNEEIKQAVQSSAGESDTWNKKLVQRRVEEAKQLAQKEELTPDKTSMLQSKAEQHAEDTLSLNSDFDKALVKQHIELLSVLSTERQNYAGSLIDGYYEHVFESERTPTNHVIVRRQQIQKDIIEAKIEKLQTQLTNDNTSIATSIETLQNLKTTNEATITTNQETLKNLEQQLVELTTPTTEEEPITTKEATSQNQDTPQAIAENQEPQEPTLQATEETLEQQAPIASQPIKDPQVTELKTKIESLNTSQNLLADTQNHLSSTIAKLQELQTKQENHQATINNLHELNTLETTNPHSTYQHISELIILTLEDAPLLDNLPLREEVQKHTNP